MLFFQVLRSGKREVCHIESCGKINGTSLTNLQSTQLFLHIKPMHIISISAFQFSKIILDLQNGAIVTSYLFSFFDLPCIL